MLKRKPKFFLRLLPTEDVDWNNIKIESNREIIHIRCLQDLYFGNKDSKPRFWSFQTDGIFYNDTQEDVYTTVMSGVIDSIYDGVSTVITACGQTCSGKSFTMGAFRSSYEFRGIVPRFINAAFSDKETKTREWKVKVSMSFVDILGNSVHDLKATPTKLTEIKNVSMTEVSTEEEALDFVFTGEGQRRTSEMATFIGSHCNNGIITFYFECLSLTRSNAVINRAKVHFVDLAGVETVGKRDCTSYKSASDQGAANLAKSDLEHVLLNMSKTDEYRSSGPLKRRCKLIEYLGRDFDPGCNIRFIGHIRPTFADLEVTLSTLKFGLRVKNIPAAPLVYYTEPNIDLVYQNIKEELNQLKEQMLVEQLLSGTREVQSDNFSQARLEHLNRLASAYLNGWSSEVNVLGNTENIITLKIFRKLFMQKAEEVESFLKERLSTDVSRTSRSSKQLRKSKDEVIEPPASKSQKQGKLSFRDLTRRRLSSKMSAKPQGLLSAAQSQLPVPSEVPSNNDIDTKQSIANLYQDIIIPEISENKIWSDFLIEQNIQSTILDELAETVRTKKKIYESAADEYNEIKVNLGRNRLALKEIAWKRQSGKNELYDRFGQIHISHEEKLTAQLVSALEDSEKDSLKLMEKHFNEWKVAANEFLQEKLGLEEKFKEYCKAKYNIPLIPPTDEAYNNNLENEIPRDVLKADQRKRHFNHLAKNLIRRGRAACAKCSDG